MHTWFLNRGPNRATQNRNTQGRPNRHLRSHQPKAPEHATPIPSSRRQRGKAGERQNDVDRAVHRHRARRLGSVRPAARLTGDNTAQPDCTHQPPRTRGPTPAAEYTATAVATDLVIAPTGRIRRDQTAPSRAPPQTWAPHHRRVGPSPGLLGRAHRSRPASAAPACHRRGTRGPSRQAAATGSRRARHPRAHQPHQRPAHSPRAAHQHPGVHREERCCDQPQPRSRRARSRR